MTAHRYPHRAVHSHKVHTNTLYAHLDIHETIIFIQIYMSVHIYIHRHMYKYTYRHINEIARTHITSLPILLHLHVCIGIGIGVPRENPGDELQKIPHTKAQRFKPQARLEPA